MASISAMSRRNSCCARLSSRHSVRRRSRVSGVRRSCDTAATNRSRSANCWRMRACIWLNTRLASRHSSVPSSGSGGRSISRPNSCAAVASRCMGRDSQRAAHQATATSAASRTLMSSSSPSCSDSGAFHKPCSGPGGGNRKECPSAATPGGCGPGGCPGCAGRSSNIKVSASTWLTMTATISSSASRPKRVSGSQRCSAAGQRATINAAIPPAPAATAR
ncbi:hypothetical protein D3C71_1147910 [compost metagenome]